MNSIRCDVTKEESVAAAYTTVAAVTDNLFALVHVVSKQ